MPRRLAKLQPLLLALSSVLLCLLLFEAIVAAMGKDIYEVDQWRYHPQLGWTGAPNSASQRRSEAGQVSVRYNNLGFRGDDIELAPAPIGVKRIVVLGDSFSAATQVEWDQTFQHRLEVALNEAGERWQVINLSMSDWGTTQQYQALRLYGHKLKPDVVVHQVFPLNDHCNNNPLVAGLCRSRNDHYRPYHLDGPSAPLRIGSLHPVLKWLREHLASAFMLEWSWQFKTVHEPSFHDPEYWPRVLESAGFPVGGPLLFAYVEEDKQISTTASGWPLTERLIAETAALSSQLKARYVGLVIPFQARTVPDWAGPKGLELALDTHLPERRLSALYSELEVSAVMMLPVMLRHPDPSPYLVEDGHLSPSGHQLVADELLALLH